VVKLAVVEQRDREGPYRDLGDLRRRVAVGPEALGALIRAGALDFTGRSRPALFLEAKLRAAHGGSGLFDVDPTEGWSPPDDPPQQRRRDEWQALGFTLGPPLLSLFPAPPPTPGPPLVASHELPSHAGRLVRVRGLVATSRTTLAANDRPVQFVTLEDEHGLAEVTLFEGTCEQVPYLTLGPYTATGVVEDRFGAFTLTARRFLREEN
jgi:DNA polymerase-3 subunit alpha